jgi:hypothetical protein
MLLPMPRVVGPLGRSREFVHRSNISAPGSSEIPACAWSRLSGFVSISLMHHFRKQEGLGNTMASLVGSSRGAR